MEKLIFATGNKDKLIEIRAILADTDYEVVSMKEAGINIDIEENGTTFEENSLIKARAIAKETGLLTMADDSGLVIDCLNGEPGIYSARYMGEDTSYEIKNAELISRVNVAAADGAGRSARYVCAVAAVFPDGSEEMAVGTMEGAIAHESKGSNGFGYDPIFFLPQFGCTAAELSPEDKNAISHRGAALRKMRDIINNR